MFCDSGSVVRDSGWESLFPVMVYCDGSVVWAPAGEFISSCDLQMSEFPWDTQTCFLDFGNLIHEESMVNISIAVSTVNLDFYLPNKEFDLTSTSASRMTFELNIGSYVANLAAARFTLILRRKPTYYVLNIFLPSLVLTALSLIVFIVPIDAGEKLSLGITILLSFSVYMLILSDNTPQTSEAIPTLSKYNITLHSHQSLSLPLVSII